jgi:hypothetical protein
MNINSDPDSFCGEEDDETAAGLRGPFPAIISGIDANQESFESEITIDYLSAGDFRFHLNRRVEHFARLLVVAQVYKSSIMLRGTVSQVEPHEAGGYGIIAVITDCRLTLIGEAR